jgi:dihydropteroate synthase
MKGTPATMQKNPSYENVIKELLNFFISKTDELKSKGIKDIIIDPGFGFGKTTDQNYCILKNLHLFRMLGYPVMAGLSRKSMATKVLETKPADALNGTTVLNTIALLNGASILRVHDVTEAIEVKKIVQQYQMLNSKQI